MAERASAGVLTMRRSRTGPGLTCHPAPAGTVWSTIGLVAEAVRRRRHDPIQGHVCASPQAGQFLSKARPTLGWRRGAVKHYLPSYFGVDVPPRRGRGVPRPTDGSGLRVIPQTRWGHVGRPRLNASLAASAPGRLHGLGRPRVLLEHFPTLAPCSFPRRRVPSNAVCREPHEAVPCQAHAMSAAWNHELRKERLPRHGQTERRSL